MQELRQSTSITDKIGPFLDEDDGKTAETGLTIAQANIRLSKNGGDYAQSNDSGGATHDEAGWYGITLDATDTNTLGRLIVQVHVSGALPVWKEYSIITQQAWDSKYSTDVLQVHVIEKNAAISNQDADHVWRRNNQNIEDSSDGDTYDEQSPYGAIAFFTNKVAPNGSNIEVFEADGTTLFYYRTPTTDSGADPITAMTAAT